MRNGKMLLTILLICSAVVLQGCATSEEKAGPAGAPKYKMGNFESVEQANIDKVYAAGLKAMEELKLPVIQKNVDSMSGEIVGRDVADKKIVITLSATPDKMTKLAIKVGMFGDEAKSRLIYEQIKKQL
jgi:hypothetical protein